MIALAFGDLHGRIRLMYERARQWQNETGYVAEVILQVGDFGVFPEPERREPEKIAKYGEGDYADLLAEGWQAPIPTWFCRGNNEDFEALAHPLLPSLFCPPDGSVVQLGSSRVAFVGGGWAPKSYAGEGKPNHLSRRAVETLMAAEFDVLVCHEAPAGTRLAGKRYAVGAPPLRALIEARKPRLVLHGHHHQFAEHRIGATRVLGLGLIAPDKPFSEFSISVEL